jgi:tetratricopeptide (TPR) repeat protein
MTRADEQPDSEALKLAATHAYEACRLDTEHAEAWSTLSFILERVGTHTDAVAAARRALALEPDNWRHHFRLASIAWGEERLRAARRTLALLPGFALAHWLAASVLVARRMLDEAARDLDAGITSSTKGTQTKFSGVALHWLRGLIHLARGDEGRAIDDLKQELANEASAHLYARECCANSLYAIGVVHLRHGRNSEAREAFAGALQRVPKHPMARLGLVMAEGGAVPGAASPPKSIDDVFCAAALSALRGAHGDAAHLVDQALSAAPPSNAGWLLPVEPLLNVGAAPAEWRAVLDRLSARAM